MRCRRIGSQFRRIVRTGDRDRDGLRRAVLRPDGADDQHQRLEHEGRSGEAVGERDVLLLAQAFGPQAVPDAGAVVLDGLIDHVPGHRLATIPADHGGDVVAIGVDEPDRKSVV